MGKQMDLREIGTLYGHALYVDVADLPYVKEQGEILSNRDEAEIKVRTTLQKVFGIKKPKRIKVVQ